MSLELSPDALTDDAGRLVADLTRAGLMLATAESCTGGLIAGAITQIAGSSAVLDRGFVTYSNEAKAAMLGIDPALIAAHGAVSEAVAEAMVHGALTHSDAQIAVSCTGIAGPGGGSAEKPVGLVHIACAKRDGKTIHQKCLFGDIGREQVRLQTVQTALQAILTCADQT
jgi:nicotinamide-nucleotide amidase